MKNRRSHGKIPLIHVPKEKKVNKVNNTCMHMYIYKQKYMYTSKYTFLRGGSEALSYTSVKQRHVVFIGPISDWNNMSFDKRENIILIPVIRSADLLLLEIRKWTTQILNYCYYFLG